VTAEDEILHKIRSAFSGRPLPSRVIPANASPTDIYQDAEHFLGQRWDEVSSEQLDRYPAAVYGFAAQAFCYYLAGIMSASIRERRPDLLVNSALVYMIDRSNIRSSWDDFFVERWCALSSEECGAVQCWILWLAEASPAEFTDSELSRAFDTLDLLSHLHVATPLALR
jgi:hypothetical protein